MSPLGFGIFLALVGLGAADFACNGEEDYLYPVAGDCRLYYACSSGSTTPRQEGCSWFFHNFDPVKLQCEWCWKVDCSAAPSPAPTAPPTTPAPSTPAPTTHVPTTPAPSTPAPSTPAPSTHAPSTAAPTTPVPTKSPVTTKPAPTSAPATKPPKAPLNKESIEALPVASLIINHLKRH